VSALLNTGLVASDRANLNAAQRLAAALIKGAGDSKQAEEHLAWFLNTAIDSAARIVGNYYKQAPAEYDTTVTPFIFCPVRPGRPTDPNRHGGFSRKVGYTGWAKGVAPVEWFDSSTERALANLLDGAAEVEVWARFHRGEYEIAYEGGIYNPDFFARLADGSNWLLEVKMDKEMGAADVQAKKAAAEQLARFLTDQGDTGAWRYALLSETAVRNARDSWPVLLAQAGAS
jgi:type III restriction enzyme